MPPLAENRFLLAAEAADLLRCSTRTIRRLLARGELGVVRSAGTILIPAEEVERYIMERYTPPRIGRAVERGDLKAIIDSAVELHRGRPKAGERR